MAYTQEAQEFNVRLNLGGAEELELEGTVDNFQPANLVNTFTSVLSNSPVPKEVAGGGFEAVRLSYTLREFHPELYTQQGREFLVSNTGATLVTRPVHIFTQRLGGFMVNNFANNQTNRRDRIYQVEAQGLYTLADDARTIGDPNSFGITVTVIPAVLKVTYYRIQANSSPAEEKDKYMLLNFDRDKDLLIIPPVDTPIGNNFATGEGSPFNLINERRIAHGLPSATTRLTTGG